MVYKLLDEPGDYVDRDGKRWNLLEANIAYTPEGVNVGWTELENMDEAMLYFGVEYSPIVEDPIE